MSKNKKKLLIITQEQFGYLTDTYYYCKYLKNDFHITYFCWDYQKEKIDSEGVDVIYIDRKKNFILRSFKFIQTVVNYIDSKTITFIVYFKGISTLLKILKWNYTFVLDFRTGCVEHKRFKRIFYNSLMRIESLFFKNKTVISKSLLEKLGLQHNCYILTLGADVISDSKKGFDSIDLLYVGTLYNRKIEDTIIGFSKFYHTYKTKIQVNYTIIGTGRNNKELKLKELAENRNSSEVINITGEIPHSKLKKYFDSNNIGISYVPITDYFDCQPPTKTFEYLLSGMPVLATQTSEHRFIVDGINGFLVQDNPESFYNGLVKIYENRMKFNSDYIRELSKNYHWPAIIGRFKSYLDKLPTP